MAVSAVVLGTTVGSLWGLASGYLGGRFDVMRARRLMEVLQSFPDLILAMAISMAIGTGSSGSGSRPPRPRGATFWRTP